MKKNAGLMSFLKEFATKILLSLAFVLISFIKLNSTLKIKTYEEGNL